MSKEKFSFHKRLRSFGYAFNGLKILIKEEHNARIHLLAAVIAIIAGFYFHISTVEWIAIVFAIGFVIALEIVNSAIENMADFVSPEWHSTIKKIKDDIERFSFNTNVSTFMICVNELTDLKCNKREILETLTILISPYVPHIAEELYHALGNMDTVCDASFPICNEEYLIESSINYPISFNGKVRFILELPADMSKEDVEKTTMANEQTAKFLEGKTPKKIIIVPGKIVNIVL